MAGGQLRCRLLATTRLLAIPVDCWSTSYPLIVRNDPLPTVTHVGRRRADTSVVVVRTRVLLYRFLTVIIINMSFKFAWSHVRISVPSVAMDVTFLMFFQQIIHFSLASHGVTTRTPHEVEGSIGNEGVVYDEILESTRQQGIGNTTGLGTIPLKANTAYQRGKNN